jgi:copper chaperone CopZ
MRSKILLLAFLAVGSARAEFLHIEVFMRDMSCPSCTETLVAAFKRMKGVEHVDTDFKEGTVILDLAAQNHVNVEQVWDTIKRIGYTPGETKVTVRGAIRVGDGVSIEVSEINRTFAIEGGKFTASEVTQISGVITPPPDPRTPLRIRVR